MKPDVEDQDENDMLLFKYLEGELPSGEKEELEKRLATDDLLQTELAYWRETIMDAEDYDIAELEKKLLKDEPAGVQSYTSFNTVILILFTSLFSLVPVSTSKQTTKLIQSFTYRIIKPIAAEKAAIEQLVHPKHLAEKTTSQQQPIRRVYLPSLESIKYAPLLPVTASIEDIFPSFTGYIEKISKLKPKKSVPVRKLSGKERRQIARMKEKSLQRRRANQFMKGREPYVVPLNTNNF